MLREATYLLYPSQFSAQGFSTTTTLREIYLKKLEIILMAFTHINCLFVFRQVKWTMFLLRLSGLLENEKGKEAMKLMVKRQAKQRKEAMVLPRQ